MAAVPARPVMHGDGLQQRDYVHVDDVVEANLCAFEADSAGVFNIGSGAPRTVRQVFDAVAAAARYEGAPVHGEAPAGEVRHSCLDAGRACRRLGWTATVPFAEGIARTVGCMRACMRRRPHRTAPVSACGLVG